MSPLEIIAEVAKLGVALRVEGANLVHRGPRGALTPELIANLKAHKPDIIAQLTRAKAPAVLCPADIAERSLIITEGDDCDRNAAERRRLAGAGYGSWQAFSDAHRAHITAALNDLSPPRNYNCRQLITETRRFLDSNWLSQAVKCGWMVDELFGINAVTPLDRHEQWGLIVGLALAPKHGDRIEHLDAKHAVIRYRVGSPLKDARRIERRFTPADSSIVWWKCWQITAM